MHRAICITQTPDIQGGKPCIVGTRMTVKAIASFHYAGHTPAEIHKEYPHTPIEQIEIICAIAEACAESL